MCVSAGFFAVQLQQASTSSRQTNLGVFGLVVAGIFSSALTAVLGRVAAHRRLIHSLCHGGLGVAPIAGVRFHDL